MLFFSDHYGTSFPLVHLIVKTQTFLSAKLCSFESKLPIYVTYCELKWEREETLYDSISRSDIKDTDTFSFGLESHVKFLTVYFNCAL